MNSTDISEITAWQHWPLKKINLVPSKPGVYVFRLANRRVVRRLKGKSDILYVGFSESNMRRRQARHLDVRTVTGDQLQRTLEKVGDIEVGWHVCENGIEAEISEGDLISLFRRDHIEVPPLNHYQPLRRLYNIATLLSLLPPDPRKAAIDALLRKHKPV